MSIKFPGIIIKKGINNPSVVKQIKVRLNELGYGPLTPDNANFGDSTEAEVIKFQKNNQLKDDGVIGELTWDRLFNKYEEVKPSSTKLALRAVEIADTQLFVREKTGKNDGTEVESYLKSVGLGKGYAWCQAFVFWCFEKASRDLNVPNPVTKTAGVLFHWNNTKGKKVKTPQPGDIFIMDFGKGLGHTGLVTEVVGNRIYTIEGNTNNGGSRDGDGVYERNRLISSILGFIRYE